MASDAQAADAAGWGAFLRDRYDVAELVKRIGEQLSQNAFLDDLYAAADKVRELQPKVGRPSNKIRQVAKDDALQA